MIVSPAALTTDATVVGLAVVRSIANMNTLDPTVLTIPGAIHVARLTPARVPIVPTKPTSLVSTNTWQTLLIDAIEKVSVTVSPALRPVSFWIVQPMLLLLRVGIIGARRV